MTLIESIPDYLLEYKKRPNPSLNSQLPANLTYL